MVRSGAGNGVGLIGIRLASAVLFLGTLLASPQTHADLFQAQLAYQQKDFAQAFKFYHEAAELGHPDAAYNVAVMYKAGQGVEQSFISAYAWATLAAEEGQPRAPTLVEELKPLLSDAGQRMAAEMRAPFEPERLQERILPVYGATKPPGYEPCKVIRSKIPLEYPAEALRSGIAGRVYVEFTIAADGRARHARIIDAVPEAIFDQAVLEAIAHAEFIPARENGKAVACPQAMTFAFAIDGARESDYEGLTGLVQRTKAKAESGDTAAQLQYGFLLAGLPQLHSTRAAALPWFLRAAQAGSPLGQFEVGQSELVGWGCRCEEPKGAIWLQRAAAAGVIEAQVTLAVDALQKGMTGERLEQVTAWLARGAGAGNTDAAFYLAALLATTPDEQHRDPRRALDLLKVAGRVHVRDPMVAEIAAAAKAGLSDYAGAKREEARAIAEAGRLHWDTAPLEARLARYQAGQPWNGNLFAY